MTTAAKLLAQKQQLLERLQDDPGPNERAEIERLLEQIDTALICSMKQAPAGQQNPTDGSPDRCLQNRLAGTGARRFS